MYTFKIYRQHATGLRPVVWFEDTGQQTPADTLDEIKGLIEVLEDPQTITSILITKVPIRIKF